MKVFLAIFMAVALVTAFVCFLLGGIMQDVLALIGGFFAVVLVFSLLLYIIFLFSEQNEELHKRLDKLEKLLSEKKEQ